MRISLADSCASGFNKWCDAHDGGRDKDGRAGTNDIFVEDQTVDHAVMTPPERPHRPWLVPGAGTL
jgi:hypothetical protein